MKAIVAVALLSAVSCVAQVSAPVDTPPQGARPPVTGDGSGGARSNEQTGVDIDQFIGYPLNKPAHLSHGTLVTHSILRAGNPYQPGPRGAVLEYRKELATATLLPYARTPMSTLPDEFFFYVKSGEGRLDDGKQSWDLRQGMAILAPPNVPHRFINTSDKPLSMIMLTWTGGPNAHSALIVRDVNLLPWCEEDAHWNNESRCVFSAADGLLQGERIFLVMTQPWAVSQPHVHGHGIEEIWTKVSSGSSAMLLGSELREMPEDAAYLVPPTGVTEHSNINLSKDRTEWWIYVARGPEQTQAAPPRPPADAAARARRPVNPNISHDVDGATVAGKPLN